MAFNLILNNLSGVAQAPHYWMNFYKTNYYDLNGALRIHSAKWVTTKNGKIVCSELFGDDYFSTLVFDTEDDAILFKLKYSC
jgi:hypothetical protein